MSEISALVVSIAASYTILSSDCFLWFCVIAVPFSRTGLGLSFGFASSQYHFPDQVIP